MTKSYSIGSKIGQIKQRPSHISELTSQALFGETFILEKQENSWVYGTLLSDQYSGWIEKKHLTHILSPNHKVIALKTIIKTKPDIKSQSIICISIGAFVEVLEFTNEWAKIKFGKNKLGYIPISHISSINLKEDNWVNNALIMLGTPYLWGGRSAFGIDCSGLIQLAFQISGFDFPRDTKDQFLFAKNNFVKTNEISQKSILFWDGHVAFTKGKKYLLHASAKKMSVVCEPILESIEYIERVTKSKTKIFDIIK